MFPELVLTGYPPEDLLLEPAFIRATFSLEKVAATTQHCAAVVGFVEEDGDLYNAAAVCAEGQVRASCANSCSPTTASSTSSATSFLGPAGTRSL